MAPKGSIAVRILGQEYRIASTANEAGVQQVQRAAALLDDTMTKIRERTGTIDTLNLAVLAALNIANRLTARQEGRGQAAASGQRIDPKRVRALIQLVESAGVPGGR